MMTDDSSRAVRWLVIVALSVATAGMFLISIRANYLYGRSIGQSPETQEALAWANLGPDIRLIGKNVARLSAARAVSAVPLRGERRLQLLPLRAGEAIKARYNLSRRLVEAAIATPATAARFRSMRSRPAQLLRTSGSMRTRRLAAMAADEDVRQAEKLFRASEERIYLIAFLMSSYHSQT
jgi:hypothetical protein